MTKFMPTVSAKYLRLFFACATIFSIVGLNSCKKAEEQYIPDASYIRFINASPTLATYNIYFDDKILNSAAIPFGGTISYAPYIFGNHTVKYTTATSIDPVFTKQINLTGNQIHSAYLIDKDMRMDVLLVIDDASVTSTTKAFVKFINLSPDAPLLSLDIKDGANLVKDKGYKLGSPFVQVDPKTYDFDIKDSNGVVKTTLTGVDMAAGRYYTIISRGMLNPTGTEQPFSAQSIINN